MFILVFLLILTGIPMAIISIPAMKYINDNYLKETIASREAKQSHTQQFGSGSQGNTHAG